MKPSLRRCSLLLVLLSACHRCPAPKTPETVYSNLTGPKCNLPSLPGNLRVPVGFPEPGDGLPADHIFITKTDFGDVIAWVDEVKAWVAAADACLQSQQSFAGSLNAWLSGAK